jgi:hypothetical protein
MSDRCELEPDWPRCPECPYWPLCTKAAHETWNSTPPADWQQQVQNARQQADA